MVPQLDQPPSFHKKSLARDLALTSLLVHIRTPCLVSHFRNTVHVREVEDQRGEPLAELKALKVAKQNKAFCASRVGD